VKLPIHWLPFALAKAQGVKTLAIVNVNGSSIAREADVVLMTHAGIEIAVASTKAYFVQVGLLSALALHMAKVKGVMTQEDYETKVSELLSVEDLIKPLLAQAEHVKFLASQYINAKNLFFIGRGLDYAVSMEASLKLKEISYVHSEAYPGGELKHGTISLITDDVPVIALTTQSDLLEKTVSNVKEVKARGARVLLLKKEDMNVAQDVADDVVNLPSLSDWLMPFTSIIIMQLFAYYSAVLRGCDVDKPRNLANPLRSNKKIHLLSLRRCFYFGISDTEEMFQSPIQSHIIRTFSINPPNRNTVWRKPVGHHIGHRHHKAQNRQKACGLTFQNAGCQRE
jgi:glutamine---fructose-6-phosphate transaminase (isomerizing)